ncbi:hypothetical protein KSS87_021675 [Heliosperma pusillum]|nr:hypothetical protein KSS87_021675 [Heliosperma pusillum]
MPNIGSTSHHSGFSSGLGDHSPRKRKEIAAVKTSFAYSLTREKKKLRTTVRMGKLCLESSLLRMHLQHYPLITDWQILLW